MNRVFLYGTLKRGFCRHQAIEGQAFLGLAKTEAAYKLFDLGDYPGLVIAENGISIEGELYSIDDDCLEQLDEIEGVAIGLYRRDTVRLLPPWNDEPTLTYIYLLSTSGRAQISHWTSK